MLSLYPLDISISCYSGTMFLEEVGDGAGCTIPSLVSWEHSSMATSFTFSSGMNIKLCTSLHELNIFNNDFHSERHSMITSVNAMIWQVLQSVLCQIETVFFSLLCIKISKIDKLCSSSQLNLNLNLSKSCYGVFPEHLVTQSQGFKSEV